MVGFIKDATAPTPRVDPLRVAPHRNATLFLTKGHHMRILSEASRETTALVNLFRDLPFETVMSFTQATKKVGFPVKSTLPAYNSARKIAARDYGVVIEAVRGHGFIRANAETIVHKRGDRHLLSLRKRAKRAANEMSIAIDMNLPEKDHLIASEKFNKFRLAGDIAAPVKSNKRETERPAPADAYDAREALRVITPHRAR